MLEQRHKNDTLQLISTYLAELHREAHMQMQLYDKKLQGHAWTEDEHHTMQALRLKCDTLHKSTVELQQAQLLHRQAIEKQQRVEMMPKCLTQQELLTKATRTCSLTLIRVKEVLQKLLKHRWAVQTVLAVSLASVVMWGVYHTLPSTSIPTDALQLEARTMANTTLLHNKASQMAHTMTNNTLLREATQMAHTIDAAAQLIEVDPHESAIKSLRSTSASSYKGVNRTLRPSGASSHESSNVTLGSTSGLMLSSLLPMGPAGKSAASVLSFAVTGILASMQLIRLFY
jgi:hypothetical protein